jgi:hypothetical protein
MIFQYFVILSKLNFHIRTGFFLPVLAAGAAMALAAAELPSRSGLASRAGAGILIYAVVLFLLSRDQVLDAAKTIRQCLGGILPKQAVEVAQ